MAQDLGSQLFLAEVQRVIEVELLKGVEAAIEEAVKRVHTEVKSRIGAIACGMLSNYRVERQGTELVIRVDIEEMS